MVLGVVLLAGAFLSVTVTVHAGVHDCGSAIAAHQPDGKFCPLQPLESSSKISATAKIKKRRRFVAIVGGIGI